MEVEKKDINFLALKIWDCIILNCPKSNEPLEKYLVYKSLQLCMENILVETLESKLGEKNAK